MRHGPDGGVPFDRHRPTFLEPFGAAEQPRFGEVQQRMQLRKPVLHQCAECQPVTGRQRADGAGLERRVVLEVACLVGDDPAPDDRLQRGKAPLYQPVAGRAAGRAA